MTQGKKVHSAFLSYGRLLEAKGFRMLFRLLRKSWNQTYPNFLPYHLRRRTFIVSQLETLILKTCLYYKCKINQGKISIQDSNRSRVRSKQDCQVVLRDSSHDVTNDIIRKSLLPIPSWYEASPGALVEARWQEIPNKFASDIDESGKAVNWFNVKLDWIFRGWQSKKASLSRWGFCNWKSNKCARIRAASTGRAKERFDNRERIAKELWGGSSASCERRTCICEEIANGFLNVIGTTFPKQSVYSWKIASTLNHPK